MSLKSKLAALIDDYGYGEVLEGILHTIPRKEDGALLFSKTLDAAVMVAYKFDEDGDDDARDDDDDDDDDSDEDDEGDEDKDA